MLCSARALTGGWISDDNLLPVHPLLQSPAAVPALLRANSDDFLGIQAAGPGVRGRASYRPLPMVTFAATNWVFGPRPLAHHLVSLAVHLATLVLLGSLLKEDGRLPPGRCLLLLAFAVHPALGEAYLWISGRFDELAGLCLCLVAWLVLRPEAGTSARWRAGAVLGVLVLGGLCKETFPMAALALLAAACLPRQVSAGQEAARELRDALRRGAPWILLWPAALLLIAPLRIGAMAHARSQGAAVQDLGAVVQRLPRLQALALETWLAPLPRPMRLLAWEYTQPLSVQSVLLFAVPLLGLLLLLARGRLRASVLLLGAVGTLAPTALVADACWYGFDRYLYLPACLLLLMARELGPIAWPGPVRRALLGLGAVWILPQLVSQPALASHYQSERAFADALVKGDPDNPAGAVYLARVALDGGDRALAERALTAALQRAAAVALPPALEHQLAATALSLGQRAEAAAVIERSAGRHPGHRELQLDLFTLRASQGRWPEVQSLARGLAQDPEHRRVAAEILAGWRRQGGVPPAVLKDLEATLTPPVGR